MQFIDRCGRSLAMNIDEYSSASFESGEANTRVNDAEAIVGACVVDALS